MSLMASIGSLLVVDELGYVPLPGEAAAALFQVVSQRYTNTSIVMTTNRGVGSWGEVLGDNTAVATSYTARSYSTSTAIPIASETTALAQ